MATDKSTWLLDTAAAFRSIEITEEGILCAQFIEAVECIGPVYDIIFAGGIVSSTLKGDIKKHTESVRKRYLVDAKVSPEVRMQIMIRAEVEELGVDKVRRNWGTATVGTLWLMRTIGFITRLLELLSDEQRLPAPECARSAYASVLKPYHGMLVGGVVTLALNLVPTRDNLLNKFAMANEEEAMQAMREYVTALKRVFDELNKFYTAQGLNFPDKA